MPGFWQTLSGKVIIIDNIYLLFPLWWVLFSAFHILLLFSHSVVSDSLQPHGLQQARLPCPEPSPWACLNSWPLSWWCYPTSSSCCPLPLPPSIFPSIRVFKNESILRIRWPKHWSFSFSISPSNEYSGLISFRMETGWISLQSKGLSRVFSNTTVQTYQFFSSQLSL